MSMILLKFMTTGESEVMSKEKIFEELKTLFDTIFDSIIGEIPQDDNAGEFVDLRRR